MKEDYCMLLPLTIQLSTQYTHKHGRIHRLHHRWNGSLPSGIHRDMRSEHDDERKIRREVMITVDFENPQFQPHTKRKTLK